MKLLILTQKVDTQDSNLGFFCAWIDLFSKHVDTLHVICLERGTYAPQPNTSIHSLGKERGKSRVREFITLVRYMWVLRYEYDAVFVHMNPVYIVLLGVVWRLQGKVIALWYTHKSVDMKLRIALMLSHRVFTASKESFRIRSNKVRVMGHGIDTEYFAPSSTHYEHIPFQILQVGRITPKKNQLLLVILLNDLFPSFHKDTVLTIIGGPVMESDREYAHELDTYIYDHNLGSRVTCVGTRTQKELLFEYQKADLLVNVSDTGSLDKDVLEAASVGLDVLTSNEAFVGILPKECIVHKDGEEIKERLMMKVHTPSSLDLRSIIVKDHTLSHLIKNITKDIESYVRN